MSRGTQLYAIPSGNIALASLARNSNAAALQIENTFDFVWIDGLYSTDQATVQVGTDTTHGGFLINVLPAAGQEKVFKDQVPISHAFGNIGIGYGPRRMPFAVRFTAGGSVSLDITNLIAGAVNLRLTFFGIRTTPGEMIPVQMAGATVMV